MINCKLRCSCGATCWVRGVEEYEDVGTGPFSTGVTLDDDQDREWEGGDASHEHDEDAEIVDTEYDEPLYDDVF